MEKIPKSNEKFNYKGVEFIIERSTAKRIVTVLINIKKR
jgi:hypothetical protein